MRRFGVGVFLGGLAIASGCFQEEAPRRDAPAALAAQTAAAPAAAAVRGPTKMDEAKPVVSELAETIRQAEDPAARREAVYAVADAGEADAAAVVGEALTDPDAEVRMAAIEAMTGFEGTASADWLSTGLGDPDPRVRRTAVEALGEIDGATARLLLQQALGDVDPGVREAAQQMLAEPSREANAVR
jgi:HEAT repeat protein